MTENHGPDIDAIQASRETSYALLDILSTRLQREQERCRSKREQFVPEKVITQAKLEIGRGIL